MDRQNPMKLQNQVYLETYGCQMNEYDSELVRSILKKAGYEFVQDSQEAQVVMLNTCSVREHANDVIYNRVHRIRHDAAGKPVTIGILGCMATNFRKLLLDDRRLKIDFIAGPDSYKVLPRLIAESHGNGEKPFDITLSEFETYADVLPERQPGVNAWIAVMRGCNNFCTFCVVPFTRGRERSRSVENVVEETRHLAANGFKQVTLLGQNVNSYRHENDDFADLITAVSTVDGIERIRFISPHPKDFPLKLLQVIAMNPKACKHLHLPLQAGSNRVLDLMNRTYTREEFLELVGIVRETIPGVSLTTDIIVGFPSETEAEFEETVDLVERVRFDAAFIFKYSPRKGTTASKKFPDDVMDAEKSRRTVRLNEIQSRVSLGKNLDLVGTRQKVLIEAETTRKSPDDYQGRSDGNTIVILPKGPYRAGDFVTVHITGATPKVLHGTPVK